MVRKKLSGGARRRSLGLLAGLAVGAAIMGIAGPASAATTSAPAPSSATTAAAPPLHALNIAPGRIQLCAFGNYKARFTFYASDYHALGGKSSDAHITENWIAQGQCQTYDVPRLGPLIGNPGGMIADITGKYNNNDNTFPIGFGGYTYVGGLGMKIFTGGTSEHGQSTSTWYNAQVNA